jgi:hypothetical protein
MNYSVEFQGKTLAKFVLLEDAIIFAEALGNAIQFRNSNIIVSSAKAIHHTVIANERLMA